MDAIGTKTELREYLRERREQIPAVTRAAYSQAIVERLIAMTDWSNIRQVHSYVPIANRAEVDTWPLFHYLWLEWPDVVVSVPGPMRQGTPTAFTVNSRTKWRTRGDIPYPLLERVAPINSLDLIVVPTLGFDSEYYRLGYGSGYYDRFLAAQPQANTVGISFSCGFVPEGLPHEYHDIALRQIITEERVCR